MDRGARVSSGRALLRDRVILGSRLLVHESGRALPAAEIDARRCSERESGHMLGAWRV
jgi:hypothetical protein